MPGRPQPAVGLVMQQPELLWRPSLPPILDHGGTTRPGSRNPYGGHESFAAQQPHGEQRCLLYRYQRRDKQAGTKRWLSKASSYHSSCRLHQPFEYRQNRQGFSKQYYRSEGCHTAAKGMRLRPQCFQEGSDLLCLFSIRQTNYQSDLPDLCRTRFQQTNRCTDGSRRHLS